ncbi:MAG: hypothetical protein ACKOA0_09980, partial [Burkholderiaceae bacterium]
RALMRSDMGVPLRSDEPIVAYRDRIVALIATKRRVSSWGRYCPFHFEQSQLSHPIGANFADFAKLALRLDAVPCCCALKIDQFSGVVRAEN